MVASPQKRGGSTSRHPQIVAKNSYVDETLFGCSSRSSPAGSPAKQKGLSAAGSGAASPACTRSPGPAVALARDGTVMLSKSHLDRMMQKSPILTPEEMEQRRAEAQEKLEKELAEAQAARAARAAAAAEAERAAVAAEPKTEMERIREKKRLETISKAQLALLEDKEEVRLMNQMVLHSKCMAARDEQRSEKVAAKGAAAAEEARIVAQMEARRKAGLAELEERERLRSMEQKRGALKILDQLAERERDRAAFEAARRRDGEEMKARIKALKDEEQKREEDRKAAARALMAEVYAGNAELAERKKQAKVAEVEEDLAIAAYIRQRDAREQELAEERERAAKAKELEVARLRAMQEKIQDNRAALDEARAKKYQDELELRQLRKAEAEKERREAMQRDLEASRVSALAWKAKQAGEAAVVEAAEAARIAAVARQKSEQDHLEEIARLEAQKKHQARLLAQMDARREMRSKEREELVAEGRHIRERLAEEQALLEAVKRLKLAELEEAGVPKKYHAQLARMTASSASSHLNSTSAVPSSAMAPRKKSAPAGESGPAGAAKRARTGAGAAAAAAAAGGPARNQRTIAAALGAAFARPTADLVLEQAVQHDQLEHRLAEDLSSLAETYLGAWKDKCHESLRDEAAAAAALGGMRGGSVRARRAAAAASFSKEDADLDAAGLRFLECFRHLQQQVFKHDAQLQGRHLEMLVLLLRSDVVHSVGDVSFQAYSLLRGYLQHFPYASLRYHEEGQWAGRPYVAIDEGAAWEPLAANRTAGSLTREYLFEEAIKEAGHNYRVDHDRTGLTAGSNRKKGGHLDSTLKLLRLCLDRAADSVTEDHNGDMLLLRYLLTLLHQDLRVRLTVFRAYADVEEEAVQSSLLGRVLKNSLLWRIWMDGHEDDKMRQDTLRLMLRLIVGVASDEELQEVVEGEDLDKAEQAAPCICTPREMSALAACLLNMLLDLMGTAEAAGGFASAGANRMHRVNQRLRLDQALKELMWLKLDAVCTTDDSSRTFLAALAPAHRLRLLSMIAMGQVGGAYNALEVTKRPAVARAQLLAKLTKEGDSADFIAAFPADPLMALRCLNQDKGRSMQVFRKVGVKGGKGASAGRPADTLAVLSSGIAFAAHSLLASGADLPVEEAAAEAHPGAGSSGGRGGVGAAAAGAALLREELSEYLSFLAGRHKELLAAGKAADMSPASLLDLSLARAAVTAMG
ncbi:flagella associated [Micractinium conductrix]|uniref:Cilia- and flagella-associated protein 45 n=1 Tax=Micractinium conductrix TaxID=554055 RepID=A0A2P6V2S2_9CHLO|nr:flagella associated [Micractinium conductrix]|eukprot:PSC68396.1 flagella associated [Micractinium conductrix]